MVAITSRGPSLAQGSPASRNLLQFDLWERKPRSGRWDWAALKVPGPGRGWGEMQRSMVGGWWLVVGEYLGVDADFLGARGFS